MRLPTPRRPGRRRAIALLAWAALATTGVVAEDLSEAVNVAAERLRTALQSPSLAGLERLLPRSGRVQLILGRPEGVRGAFSTGQTRALLGRFVSDIGPEHVSIDRVDFEPPGLVWIRATLHGKGGASAGVQVELRREANRWTLRELRETAP